MSTHRVEVVSIEAIIPHPNADRLELVQVKGWQCVTGKGNFKIGDRAVYLPVDSVLSAELETELFPPDSKIKLHKSRIRSIKIRGTISQGMVIPAAEILPADLAVEVGDDVADFLGVTKYEPPEAEFQAGPSNPKKGGKSQTNPNFSKYTDIENVKNFPRAFAEGEMVYMSEKMHGTSARYGYVPRFYGDTASGALRRLWDRFVGIFRGGDALYDYVFGSRNVQLQDGRKGPFYKENVYAKIGEQFRFEDILEAGECVYGEIVGSGIQKNYAYGCAESEHKFFAYDVMVDGRWLNHREFAQFCDSRNIPRVPELYVGPYSKAVELQHRDGDSTVGGQKIREGVVIKPVVEDNILGGGRLVLKSISDAYYLEDNSDFH